MAVLSAGCSSVSNGSRSQSDRLTSVANPVLRQELLERVKEDQAIANEYYPKLAAGQVDAALNARREASLSSNTVFIKAVIKQYGWPSPELVGRDGSDAAFLLVQHSDNAFRKKMLPVIRAAYRNHITSGQNYALLLDIVLVSEGKPQVYGTRLKPFNEWKDRKPIPEPIEDAANVDERRATVGLFPESTYLQMMREMWYPGSPKASFEETIQHTRMGELMLGAIDYLIRLKEQNRLPGVGKDAHGTFPFSAFPIPKGLPVWRTQTFIKNNDDISTYYYTVEKLSPDGGWQLKKAWRRDGNGKIVERYSVGKRASELLFRCIKRPNRRKEGFAFEEQKESAELHVTLQEGAIVQRRITGE